MLGATAKRLGVLALAAAGISPSAPVVLPRPPAQDAARSLLESYRATPDSYSGKTDLFGHALSEFSGFYDEWRQVTVRYRTDTHEMRFVYANDIAMRALVSGNGDYPDGAVFGKIGFITEEDKAFPSSVVPSGTRRYQFMVRDARRYADTGGWGYLLFSAQGTTFPGEPVAVARACAACHHLVSDRGDVFSQPILTAPQPLVLPARPPPRPLDLRVAFVTVGASSLGADLVHQFPLGTRTIRSVRGDLTSQLFEGTLDEIRPTLAGEAIKSGSPALLTSSDEKLFSYAYVDNAATCSEGKVDVRYGISVPMAPGGAGDETMLRVGHYCEAR